MSLRDVQEAARAYSRAKDALIAAVQAAYDNGNGAEVTAIATAAGVTRPTIYRWVKLDPAAPGHSVNVRAAVDEALAVLMPHMDESTARQLAAGLRHPDVGVKLRRLDLALKNLPGGYRREDRDGAAVVDTAVLVAERARQVYASGGRWPETVNPDRAVG